MLDIQGKIQIQFYIGKQLSLNVLGSLVPFIASPWEGFENRKDPQTQHSQDAGQSSLGVAKQIPQYTIGTLGTLVSI